MKKKYLNWIIVLLVIAIVVTGCVYCFRWIERREGRLIPSNESLGYDVSVYVGVDKEFVDSALARDQVIYKDITTAEERALGQARYAIHERIQGLEFATTLLFATKTMPEEGEESSSSNGLIPDINLQDKEKDATRILCIGYVKEWTGLSAEWTDAQKEAANTIYQLLVKKYGALKKDNGATYIANKYGSRFTPANMPESLKGVFEEGDITNEVISSFKGAWIKTIKKNSLTDHCVNYEWGHDPENKMLFIRISQYDSLDYPYQKPEENETKS